MVDTCAECGVLFEVPEFVVTDLSNYKIRQQRVYKKGDHFKEVLSQFQGREGKHIPRETLEIIKTIWSRWKPLPWRTSEKTSEN